MGGDGGRKGDRLLLREVESALARRTTELESTLAASRVPRFHLGTSAPGS